MLKDKAGKFGSDGVIDGLIRTLTENSKSWVLYREFMS